MAFHGFFGIRLALTLSVGVIGAIGMTGCSESSSGVPRAAGGASGGGGAAGGGGVAGIGGAGGEPDGGIVCAPPEVECNGVCIDTSSSAEHRGACDEACGSAENGSVACVEGECTTTCDEDYADCTDAPGCETHLPDDALHCGACDEACPALANSTAMCAESTCGFTCDAGFDDCTEDPGCETKLGTDPEHCGGCDMACSAPANADPTCQEGACDWVCTDGFHDCQPGAAGCETPTVDDDANCGGCNIVCNGEERCIDSGCHAPKRAFVTDANQRADFGGISVADARCQAEANAQSLGGTWLAWVSDSSSSPSARFVRSPAGYERLDGVTIADTWDDLVDGSIDVTLDVTPTGAIVTSGATWTATNTDGTAHPSTCQDWTVQSGQGRVGILYQRRYPDQQWTSWTDQNCSFPRRFYCFEQ